jgi:hypothetical protein
MPRRFANAFLSVPRLDDDLESGLREQLHESVEVERGVVL